MLEPEVFDYILNSLSVHKQLQESILRDIARRIVKNGISPADALTETTVHQARMLQSAGVVYNDAVKIIADYSYAIYYDIQTAFDAAEVEIFNYDDEVILSNGYEPKVVKNLSPAMKQIWEAALSKTFTEANNLTKTIAITSQNAFISACDLAHMQIASGSFTYQQAIANAVKQASQQSMRVLYPSGATASTDYAVRRAVLTSINQSAGQIMSMRANELNHDLMQTTAHYGARPEHAEWQGQVVSMSGAEGYLSAADIGYGSVTGIFGANCNHSWYMYFGHPAYTPEQLRDMKEKTVTYNGKEMSVYDARLKQRGYERSIKKTKAELVAYDEALKHLPLEEQTALKFQFQNASVKLKGQEAKLADYCRQTGLKRDKFREQMFAAETEDTIKAWSKSTSSKAVASAQKYYDKFKFEKGAENLPKTLDKYYDLKYNNPPAYKRLRNYLDMIDIGQVSPLVTFEQYQNIALAVEKELFGIVTPNGIEVKGYTAHSIGRIIGHSVLYNNKYNRPGVTIAEMKGCLTNGKVGKFQIDKDGKPSWAFKGSGITVSVNPDTGEIVQVNRGAK